MQIFKKTLQPFVNLAALSKYELNLVSVLSELVKLLNLQVNSTYLQLHLLALQVLTTSFANVTSQLVSAVSELNGYKLSVHLSKEKVDLFWTYPGPIVDLS